MSDWKPMTENGFPYPHRRVLIAAFYEIEPEVIEIFRCRTIEHGAYIQTNSTMVSLNEEGWIPFAFREDDIPPRNDEILPPMWKDYLTEASDA